MAAAIVVRMPSGAGFEVVGDLAGSLGTQDRHGRVLDAVAQLHPQRLPRRRWAILGQTHRELARVADGGGVQLAGPGAEHVASHEAQCAAHHGVGPVAGTEGVVAGGHVQFGRHGAADQ